MVHDLATPVSEVPPFGRNRPRFDAHSPKQLLHPLQTTQSGQFCSYQPSRNDVRCSADPEPAVARNLLATFTEMGSVDQSQQRLQWAKIATASCTAPLSSASAATGPPDALLACSASSKAQARAPPRSPPCHRALTAQARRIVSAQRLYSSRSWVSSQPVRHMGRHSNVPKPCGALDADTLMHVPLAGVGALRGHRWRLPPTPGADVQPGSACERGAPGAWTLRPGRGPP